MILENKKIVIMGVRNKWSIAFGAVKSASEQGAKVICTTSETNFEKVKQLSSEIPLSKSDISMLNDFGGQLGKTDTEGQLKHLELYEVSFSKQLSSALDAITKKSKLYKTMGFFAGSAIALMMI